MRFHELFDAHRMRCVEGSSRDCNGQDRKGETVLRHQGVTLSEFPAANRKTDWVYSGRES